MGYDNYLELQTEDLTDANYYVSTAGRRSLPRAEYRGARQLPDLPALPPETDSRAPQGPMILAKSCRSGPRLSS